MYSSLWVKCIPIKLLDHTSLEHSHEWTHTHTSTTAVAGGLSLLSEPTYGSSLICSFGFACFHFLCTPFYTLAEGISDFIKYIYSESALIKELIGNSQF